MGWVSRGTGFEDLDDFTFGLEPDTVGGPVESPAGWHLVKVLDVLDARNENFDDAETQRLALRMYLKEKLDNYVVDLRNNRFEVMVYDDELTRRFQKEADFIAELNKKAAREGSVTEQRAAGVAEVDRGASPGIGGCCTCRSGVLAAIGA